MTGQQQAPAAVQDTAKPLSRRTVRRRLALARLVITAFDLDHNDTRHYINPSAGRLSYEDYVDESLWDRSENGIHHMPAHMWRWHNYLQFYRALKEKADSQNIITQEPAQIESDRDRIQAEQNQQDKVSSNHQACEKAKGKTADDGDADPIVALNYAEVLKHKSRMASTPRRRKAVFRRSFSHTPKKIKKEPEEGMSKYPPRLVLC